MIDPSADQIAMRGHAVDAGEGAREVARVSAQLRRCVRDREGFENPIVQQRSQSSGERGVAERRQRPVQTRLQAIAEHDRRMFRVQQLGGLAQCTMDGTNSRDDVGILECGMRRSSGRRRSRQPFRFEIQHTFAEPASSSRRAAVMRNSRRQNRDRIRKREMAGTVQVV